MYLDAMMSVVRREIARTMRKLHNPPRVGLVTSYDKKTHRVKIQFQPEGTESGWIPLTGLAVGNGYGVASAPNIGDSVEVHNQEANHMVARVMTRHWSTENNPPQLEAGEHATVHKHGSTVVHKQDGSIVIAGPGYTQTGQNKWQSGNTTTQKNGTTNQQQTGQEEQKPTGGQVITVDKDGNVFIDTPKGTVNIDGKKGLNIESTGGDVHIKSSGGVIYLDSATKVWVNNCDLYVGGKVFADQFVTPGQKTSGPAFPQFPDQQKSQSSSSQPGTIGA